MKYFHRKKTPKHQVLKILIKQDKSLLLLAVAIRDVEFPVTVTIDLTVLDPQTGVFPVTDEIDCSGTPVTVSAIQLNTDPTISYIWSGPCFTQSFPQDPNISVSCGGVYTVYAEQTVAGVTCVSPTFSVTVIENITPPIADPGQLIAINSN